MIPLAISNIAWSPDRHEDVLPLLRDAGVCGLEIAPGLAFVGEADPFAPSQSAVDAFVSALDAHGLRLVSMQSLLFGVDDAHLFGPPAARNRFMTGIRRAIDLANRLGIANLVLGAPTNRAIPEGMDHADAEAMAVDMFRDLGRHCAGGVARLALEPNPHAYGTNFMNTADQTAAIVRRVDHPNVTLNFDLGALAMNDEGYIAGDVFDRMAALTSHVHISEPHLARVPADLANLEQTVRRIVATGYRGWFSIEMRRSADNEIATIRTSVTHTRAALMAAVERPST